jgi:hypothetical protein
MKTLRKTHVARILTYLLLLTLTFTMLPPVHVEAASPKRQAIRAYRKMLGKEKVYFRIYPSSDKLTILPENPEDDINSGTMKAGFSHPFVLRLGKVSVKSLKN